MMKLLFLTKRPGLLKKNVNKYNGGGWVDSLQSLLKAKGDVQLAMTYLSNKKEKSFVEYEIIYYPIYSPSLSYINKILLYHGGYKNIDENRYVDQIERIIGDFQPDIIQIFGMENPLKTIVGKTHVPVILHLQGFLGPISNAYWPYGFNSMKMSWPPSYSETIMQNGFVYMQKSLSARGEFENKTFKSLKYVMGRTEWDNHLSFLMSPHIKYYHIDELLRPVFYENAGVWKVQHREFFRIMSTISNVIYKGYDIILKTAQILKQYASFNFEWIIAGIDGEATTVKLFEKTLGLSYKELGIQFLGVQSAVQLCKEELQSDVFVHPSYIDNSPNSVCEAQLLGLPVIASHVGGIPSLVKNNFDGITVAVNDPYNIAYHIINLYNNPQLANKISDGAKTTASKRHDKDKIYSDLMYCYKEIIEENRK